MKQEDRISFVDAMEKEIHEHEEGGPWTVVHHNNLPNKSRPIKSIWSFKSRRKPDGELLKHKYRLCEHGVMQQWGYTYLETYSRVINMLNVRLILQIDKIQNLDSTVRYFVLAFQKVDLE